MIMIMKAPMESTAETIEHAQGLALKALHFLAEDTARLSHFVNVTGLSLENIRTDIQSDHFLLAILDHLLQDESLLLAFCAHKDCDPGHIQPAKLALEKIM